MSGYPCCCAKEWCEPFCKWTNEGPDEFIVDLGVGGWVDRANLCDQCNEVSGQFVLSRQYPLDPELRSCSWKYTSLEWCQQSDGSCDAWYKLEITFGIGNKSGSETEWDYGLFVSLMTGDLVNCTAIQNATYASDSDVFGTNCQSVFVDGKVTLDKVGTETKYNWYPCTGTLPAQVEAWPNT